MKIIKLFIVFFLLAFSVDLSAQQLKENEIVVIKGEKYVLHQVRTGETVYSISRQFKVDSSTLAEHNPAIEEGLKVGEILKIPYRDGVDIEDKPVHQKGDPSRFDFHTIRSRNETPYFIAKEYGITVEEIYAYNPEVRRFKKGTRLRIPRWDEPETDEAEEKVADEKPEPAVSRELVEHIVQPGETLRAISRRYNISESEIIFYNPGARELKEGETLFLPGSEIEPDAQPRAEDEEPGLREGEKPEDVDMGDYFNHTIVSGETMWSVSRKYGLTEEELKELNPVLKTGFPAGVTIRIPVKEEELAKAEPVNEEAFIRHPVQAGETLYGLANRYNISIPDIKKYNPALENRDIVQGETILVPKIPVDDSFTFIEGRPVDSLQARRPKVESDYYDIELPETVPEECRPQDDQAFSRELYDVALFLPLFIEANDTLNRKEQTVIDSLMANDLFDWPDTLVEEEKTEEMFRGFFRDSENYMQFYEGVLLAVDSMQQAGMKIRLNVYDTQQNAGAVREVIYSDDFLKNDLIIGPVFPNVQNEVADLASKNRIPMVSPLSSRSRKLNNNSYFFQVNPSRDYLAMKTAEMVAEEFYNSNIIVFKTGETGQAEGEVVNRVREKLLHSGYWGLEEGANFSIYDFEDEGPYGFRHILSDEKENVVLVPTLDEGELSVAISNIDNLSGDFSITLVGFNRYQQFSSIDVEHFHNLKLHFISPYWVDYEKPSTIRFLKKFRENFHTEPDNYGIQGYDVAFYFLSAIKNYGKDFNECLPYLQKQLVQGNYRFEKVSRFGGYMNQGVSVVSYGKDYEVDRKRVIGQRRFVER